MSELPITQEESQQLDLKFVGDNENEKLILIAFIKNNSLLDKHFHKLDKNYFLFDENKAIFGAISHLYNNKVPIALDNLNIYFKQINTSYLTETLAPIYEVLYKDSTVDIGLPIEKLFNDHYKHVTYNNLSKIYEKVFDSKVGYKELSNIITDTFEHSYVNEDPNTGLRSINDIITTDYLTLEKERLDGKGFYTYGITTLDKCLTEGAAPKKNTILASRSGMGKSMIAVNCMDNLAHKGIPVALFSLEMPATSNLDRLLSKNSGVPLGTIIKNRGHFTPEETQKFIEAKKKLIDNKFMYIDDRVTSNLKVIKNQVQLLQEKLQQEYIVVFIDLLSKLRDVKEVARGYNLAQNYELVMDEMIEITRQLNVHIVGLVQLNRDMEKEGGRKNYWMYRPRASDLKNANALQEGADNLFLLYRAKYYDPTLEDDVLEIHIEKQRQGQSPVECYTMCYPSISKITSTDELILPYDKRSSNI